MRRILSIIVPVLMFAAPAAAQELATRERTPKIKSEHWLDGIEPRETEYTYIEFVHSRSVPCLESVLKIKRHIDRTDRPFRVIFVTREDEDIVDRRLRECLGGYIGTIVDTSGRIFRDFGVGYVPFGVIIDRKRRALWFGNPLTAESDFFEKIISAEE